jgi:hypothetical protein
MPASSELHLVGEPIAWARAHPGYFFNVGGCPTEAELAVQLQEGVRILTGRSPAIDTIGSWTALESDVDWFFLGRFPAPPDLKFTALPAFPELAPNSTRPEFVLAVFARDVLSVTAAGPYTIKGNGIGSTGARLSEPRQSGRLLAFRGIAA